MYTFSLIFLHLTLCISQMPPTVSWIFMELCKGLDTTLSSTQGRTFPMP
ncbi:hypothetical protein KP509_07G031000 [Ceratopteris richardii]|uniref:Uncharacterized protein n=1 Tax=Ceratopteris richardii TaxID=49495 RepID=A0A8T2UJV2_CERRI|nr:hypothetical protein KP509_07G031000 [Ceratopteris richardii]